MNCCTTAKHLGNTVARQSTHLNSHVSRKNKRMAHMHYNSSWILNTHTVIGISPRPPLSRAPSSDSPTLHTLLRRNWSISTTHLLFIPLDRNFPQASAEIRKSSPARFIGDKFQASCQSSTGGRMDRLEVQAAESAVEEWGWLMDAVCSPQSCGSGNFE